MRIRRFRKEDAGMVSRLIRKTLFVSNAKDYPRKIIDYIVKNHSPSELIEGSKKNDVFVAVQGNCILGTATIGDDWIGMVFVTPSDQGRGIGRKLIERIEKAARKWGVKSLVVRSSITAWRFYEKLGYKRKKTMMTKSGRVIVMKKRFCERVSAMRIRRFRKEDAGKCSDIIRKCFQTVNSRDYSKKSIEEQVENNSPKNLIERSKKTSYFVAAEKNNILGIGGYDKIKVHTFFVDSRFHRKGIGKKILERVLSEAKKDGIETLDAWSTFYAEGFYSSFGFRKIREFTLPGKHSPITFILMRKKL
jgi:GNAT superfamily N-acetyltransferase